MPIRSDIENGHHLALLAFLATATAARFYGKRSRLGMKSTSDNQDDLLLLKRAHQIRLALSKPQQSHFRVVAILALSNGKTIVGTNDEPSPNIGAAICAERAAFLQFRVQYMTRTCNNIEDELPHVTTVYIVTDAPDEPITPGTLCREYMVGHAAVRIETTRIVLQSANQSSEPWTMTLQELYPFPSIYNRLDVKDQVTLGSRLLQNSSSSTVSTAELVPTNVSLALQERTGMPDEFVEQLFSQALKQTEHQDDSSNDHFTSTNHIHAIRYGAAAAIRNLVDSSISIVSAAQCKALEYGSTLDAICQLAPQLLNTGRSSTAPSRQQSVVLAIVMLDQFGIPHSPFAPARSLLAEHGQLQDCWITVSTHYHGHSMLQYHVVQARDLAPCCANPFSQ